MARTFPILVLALAGCLGSDPKGAPADPFCPSTWKFDVSSSAAGNCSPPIGYTALVWAELGGSGVYGFVRSGAQYLSCHVPHDAGSAGTVDPSCEVRMIAATEVDAYLATDIIDTTIRLGSIPVASAVTSSQGVYKMRLDPNQYRLTGIDPVDGTRFWSANLQVISQALAACAIDVYPP